MNYGEHLYLVDQGKKAIKYVKGFQEIGNPELDSVNKIICSNILSGQIYTNFYAFDLNNDITNLGHSFVFSGSAYRDSINYASNFKKVLEKRDSILRIH